MNNRTRTIEKRMKDAGRGALFLYVAAVGLYTFMVPDALLFREGSLARILFTHVPCAFVASLFIALSFWYGIAVLRSGSDLAASRLNASIELGTIFAGLTMATGILFSRYQWGAWWHNDPRQVSFLIVLFLYLGLVAIRGSFSAGSRQDRSTAAYAIGAALPAMFLIFVFPRLKFIAQTSFHPTTTIAEGQLDWAYSLGLWGSVVALLLVSAVLFRIRVQNEVMQRRLEKDGYDQVNRGRSAATGVVRPVVLSEKD